MYKTVLGYILTLAILLYPYVSEGSSFFGGGGLSF